MDVLQQFCDVTNELRQRQDEFRDQRAHLLEKQQTLREILLKQMQEHEVTQLPACEDHNKLYC